VNIERLIPIVRDLTCLAVGATGILYIVFTTKDPSNINEFLLSILAGLVGAPTVLGAVSLVRNSTGDGASSTRESQSRSTPPSAASSSSSSSSS
jgi:hypothetical protein